MRVAATFSSRCSTEDVPGIGSMTGERAQEPRERDLRGRRVVLARDPVERASRLGEPARRQRGPGQEADPLRLAGVEHVLRARSSRL